MMLPNSRRSNFSLTHRTAITYCCQFTYKNRFHDKRVCSCATKRGDKTKHHCFYNLTVSFHKIIYQSEKASWTVIGLEPLGDRAILIWFEDQDTALRWADSFRMACPDPPEACEAVPVYRVVAVHFDPDQVDLYDLLARLGQCAPSSRQNVVSPEIDRGTITIPVIYDGPDLPDVASRLGLSVAKVIMRHQQGDYRVEAMGFAPGFGYLGPLPTDLGGLPRREVPRIKVPAGSVAMVGGQTAIYPEDSAGGWHIIGRTTVSLADPERETFLFRVGARVRFEAVAAEDPGFSTIRAVQS